MTPEMGKFSMALNVWMPYQASSGTSRYLAGIVGLGAAIERLKARLPEEKARLCALRDRLIDGVLSRIPDAKLNGARGDGRLPVTYAKRALGLFIYTPI